MRESRIFPNLHGIFVASTLLSFRSHHPFFVKDTVAFAHFYYRFRTVFGCFFFSPGDWSTDTIICVALKDHVGLRIHLRARGPGCGDRTPHPRARLEAQRRSHRRHPLRGCAHHGCGSPCFDVDVKCHAGRGVRLRLLLRVGPRAVGAGPEERGAVDSPRRRDAFAQPLADAEAHVSSRHVLERHLW